MSTFKYFDEMERYARGPITDAERVGFEQRLKQVPDLAAEWADYLLIARSIRTSLRAQYSVKADIGQLVEDARDLAKTEGLLFLDEDIWAYLRGKMPAEKAALLEKRRKADTPFANRIDQETSIVEGVRQYSKRLSAIDKIRDSLRNDGFISQTHQSIERDILEEKSRKGQPFAAAKPTFWGKTGPLFVLILALAAFGVYFLKSKNADPVLSTELVAEQKSFLKNRSASFRNDANAQKAAQFLEQNLPDVALSCFQKATDENRNTPEGRLFEGIAFLMQSNFSSALPRLDGAANDPNLKPSALWLAALACREQKDFARAKKYLETLALETSAAAEPYVEKAKKLSQRLP